MKKTDLIKYFDEYLKNSEYEDDSKNGLQVDSEKKEIKKIGYAVDSTSFIFDKAKEESVDMILTHHGLFWGREETLTGINYKKIKTLIKNDICLYASHLPLDAHPEIGNNIGLLKAFVNIFGLQEEEYSIEEFGEYNGKTVGFGLKFKKDVHISNIVTPYAERMQLIKKLYNFGNKEYINSIAFLSGRAGFILEKAFEDGYDVFITGELNHEHFILARELGQSVLVGGHYETEKIGPKLLAYHLKDKFGIEVVFLDEKY